MFGKAKTWHGSLSKAGKITLWAITAIVGGSAINVAANPNQTVPRKTPAALVQQDTPKKPVVTTKSITETSPVVFTKTTVNDSNIAQGNSNIKVAGVNGVKTFTYEITYEDNKEINKKLVKEEVTTAAITEVTAVGTKAANVTPKPSSNCDPNYTPCIPNVSYDLDCPDIGHRVTVTGTDHHRLDADHDGTGCDSY